MNFFDQLLKTLAPGFALRRLQNQLTYNALSKNKRRFDGAGQGRRFASRTMSNLSQNADININLPALRSHSREAVKNNPYAQNGVRRIANNVVGTGILANPVCASKASLHALKKAWADWADYTHCDFDDLQNFYGLELLVIKTVVKSGECYVRRVWDKNRQANKIALRLQILDPDFIDHNKNTVPTKNENYTVAGIQYDKNGQRIGYWVFDKHPAEAHSQSKLVDAGDILHVFEVNDPGQNHGLPFTSSVLLRMKDFDEFEDAQLMKQKIAACFSAFITQSLDAGVGGLAGDELTEQVEPGIIQRLNPGDGITFANPPSVDGFKDFSRQSLIGQAAGMGMSYESYTGDLSGVNFSSGRMGWLEFQRGVEILQWSML